MNAHTCRLHWIPLSLREDAGDDSLRDPIWKDNKALFEQMLNWCPLLEPRLWGHHFALWGAGIGGGAGNGVCRGAGDSVPSVTA